MEIPEMEQQNLNKFLVLKISWFESGTRNSHNPEQDVLLAVNVLRKTPKI